MLFKKVPVGAMSVNCYLVADETSREAAVIDPGGEGERIYGLLAEQNLKLKYILLTHGHGDHIAGVKVLREKTGAPLYIHKGDAKMLGDKRLNYSAAMGAPTELTADQYLEEGTPLYLGELKLEVLHTPGHSPGGVCFKIEQILISGDTLFSNSVGRTDLYGGDMNVLVQSIREKLLVLDDEVTVYPGHGPATRIGIERLTNPFVR